MGRLIGGLLDNDSMFGKIMTKIGIIIGANLMFVLCCLPVVTIGPGLAALYYVMLKSLRGDGVLNPFKEFWKGLRMNLRQGIVSWLVILLLAAFLVVEIRFCSQYGGIFEYFKYGLYTILFAEGILGIYLYPVMAAFADTLTHLLRNALFFAARRPHKLLLALALYVIPIGVTILDVRMRPLYGFLWVVCGAGLLAMLVSELLIKDFEVYLPPAQTEMTDEENPAGTAQSNARSQRKILQEMKRLDH